MTEAITVERDLVGTAAEVYAAIVTAEKFRIWFGTETVEIPRGSMTWDARVGGTWSATMHLPDGTTKDWVGEFVELDPARRVVLTLTDEPDNDARAAVTFDLVEHGNKTRISVHQPTPGWSSEAQAGLRAGYAAFLESMQRVVTGELTAGLSADAQSVGE